MPVIRSGVGDTTPITVDLSPALNTYGPAGNDIIPMPPYAGGNPICLPGLDPTDPTCAQHDAAYVAAGGQINTLTPTQTPASGMPGWAWVAIGGGVLLVLVVASGGRR